MTWSKQRGMSLKSKYGSNSCLFELPENDKLTAKISFEEGSFTLIKKI